ncbi:MAG: hypothetical protein WAM60_19680 [Candidatus Promineifilaceae bacterium]
MYLFRSIKRYLAWLVIAGFIAAVAAFLLLLVLHNRPVTLPVPTGPYGVGRVEYDWLDPSRPETLTADPNDYRELTVWVWYPTDGTPDTVAPYWPSDWINGRNKEISIFSLLTQNLKTVQAHAVENAPLSAISQTYPVLLFQPGLGPTIGDYSTLVEGLASAGYIVVGSNPTYSANVVVFEDGRIVDGSDAGNVPDNASPERARDILNRLMPIWVRDDAFVLDQLAQLNAHDPGGLLNGRMALDKVGVWGHSFGGAAAAQFCSQDARCQAGVNLDGYPYGDVVQTGLPQPFLFIWSQPPDPDDPLWQQAQKDAEAVQTIQPHEGYQIMINGMRHFNFADFALFYNPVLKVEGLFGTIDGRRGLHIAQVYMQAFFDYKMRGQETHLFDGPSAEYPEVQFGLSTN